MKFETEKNETGLTLLDVVLEFDQKEFVIPEKITGVAITRIGEKFLNYNTSLKEITISNSVQEIGDYFLYSNTSLKEITMPSSVKVIGDYFLYSNTRLKEIKIPSSVQEIGKGFLYYNTCLKEITIPSSVKVIGDYFLHDNTCLKEIKIPSSVQEIGKGFLHSNASLTTITISNSVRKIGDYFLYYNTSLKEITIENKKYKCELIDNYITIIYNKKKKNDYTIKKCKLLHNSKFCYIVQKGKFFAHGKTIKEAIEDLEFKILQQTFDVEELVDKIKEKNKITINDYRLLTGSCKFGIDDFIKRKKIKKDYLMISEYFKLAKNEFGYKKMTQLFN